MVDLKNKELLIPSDQKVTLVTALFDVSRRENNPNRRQAKEYLHYGEFVLSLDLPMVIYVDPPFADFVRERRKSFPQTQIVSVSLEEMPYYAQLGRFIEYRQRNPIYNASPNKDTPLYMVTIWSKFTILERVVKENPFDSTHFGWIDFAIAHNTGNRHFPQDQIFTRLDDQIRLLLMAQFDENLIKNDLHDYLRYIRGNISANYMTASRENMLFFCQEFHQVGKELLDKGYGPSEEMILPLLCVRHPEKYSYFYGDYDGVLLNYRRVRGLIRTYLLHLSRCREYSRHDCGVLAGEEGYRSLLEGILEATPLETLQMLDEYYIAAYYYVGKEKALEIARKTVDLIMKDPEYEQAFHLMEDHLRSNFSHLSENVFLPYDQRK